MGVTISHEPCEVCGSKNNLAVWHYDDGSTTQWCYTEGCTNKETRRRPDDAQFTLLPDRLVPNDLKGLLSIQTVSAYDIRIDRSGNSTVMFVYRDETGSMVKAKVRNYNIPKDSDGHFYNVGKTKQPMLYGKETRRGNRCIITEGEWDCVAAREMTGYTAVSIDNGNMAMQSILADLPYLESFEVVYVVVDNDPQGISTCQKILEVLPLAIPVLLPMLPKRDETYTKDAFDFLKEGYADEFRQAVHSAKAKVPSFILPGEELLTRVANFLRNKNQYKGWSTNILGLDALLGGVRESEVTFLVGDPGKGKSTTARFLIGAAVDADKNVLYISLEDEPERAAVRFMEMYFDKVLINNPDAQVTDEELAELGQVFLTNKIQMTDCTRLDPDALERQVRYAVLQNNAKLIVLDHLTIAAQRMDEEANLMRALSKFAARIDELKKKYKVHFLVISHNHRPAEKFSKDDSIGLENDPVPTLRDAFGSSVIEQIADNYLAIRMMRSGAIELYLLKNRLWKETGKVTLRYNNGRYIEQGRTQTTQTTSDPTPSKAKEPKPERRTDTTERRSVPGGEGKPNGESSLGVNAPVDSDSPVVEADTPNPDTVHELHPRLHAAQRLLRRNQGDAYVRVDAQNVSNEGAVPM